jgi:hypothetical protein
LLITAYDEPTTDTRVAVVNTMTGTQVGSLTLAGQDAGSALLTADGTRALIPTVVGGFSGSTTRVAVVRIV